MSHTYVPTPRVSQKCDYCHKNEKFMYLSVDDYSKICKTIRVICKECYNIKFRT